MECSIMKWTRDSSLSTRPISVSSFAQPVAKKHAVPTLWPIRLGLWYKKKRTNVSDVTVKVYLCCSLYDIDDFRTVRTLSIPYWKRIRSNYYRPQTKLRKGNLFKPALWFCSQQGVYTPLLGRPPHVRHWTPPRQTPPSQADTPPIRDSHCSGWYASHWNAFFVLKLFRR